MILSRLHIAVFQNWKVLYGMYIIQCVSLVVCVCVCARVNGSRSNGALGADKGSTKRGTKEATLPLCPCATTTSSFYLSFI